MSELVLGQLRDKSYLASIISSARDAVVGKGFMLRRRHLDGKSFVLHLMLR